MNCTNILPSYLLKIFGEPENQKTLGEATRNDYAFVYVLTVMFLFAALVVILLWDNMRERRNVNKNDPYHIYMKNNWSLAEEMRARTDGAVGGSVRFEL
ncbi:KCNE3 protein, partial [Polypterus senegalus]